LFALVYLKINLKRLKNTQSDAELATKYDIKELELRLEAKINEVNLIWLNCYD